MKLEAKSMQNELRKRDKREVSNEIFLGDGFPNGKTKGEVVKARRLKLDPSKKGLFSRYAPRKIMVAQELLTVDGESLPIAAFFMSENVRNLLPNAIVLAKCNNELLNGLVAADSSMPNKILPLYVWNIRSDFFDRVKNGEILEINVEHHKAMIQRISKKLAFKVILVH